MIRAVNIGKSYGNLEVLKDINLEIQTGEVISIVGASGAGKTTLLQILGTLDKADEGEVWYDEMEVTSLGARKLSEFRNRNIGFIFQFHHLLPEFTSIENVCMPALISGAKKSVSEKRAAELLDFLGLKDRLLHKPAQLSGGEQQRVAVARALMNQPKAVLADEPSGNLDTENASELHKMFFRLRDEFGQTFVIVTHNDELASSADRKIVMKDGLLI
ncbi:MAG: ATP-binding cassette domain-containing protein [Bacteroidetes bacterium]|nr:ATP-binding cassette domain-containing protein [Bacteroidota bacterium]